MTTVELAGLLCRHTQWPIPTAMPLTDVRALVMCINDGAAKVRQLGAEDSIREPLDVYLREPQSLLVGAVNMSTAVVVASASVPLTADTDYGTCDADVWPLIVPPPPGDALAWLEEAAGSWISIDSGSGDWGNRLLRADTLMYRHLGPSVSSAPLLLVHDSAPLGFQGMTAVVDDLEIADLRGNTLAKLVQESDRPHLDDWSARDRPVTGIPSSYRVLPINGGEGLEPGWAIRVSPAPSAPYRLRGWCVRSASRCSLEDMRTPRTLPFTDTIVEQVIIPFALRRMQAEKLLTASDPNAIASAVADAERILSIETQTRRRGPRRGLTKTGF